MRHIHGNINYLITFLWQDLRIGTMNSALCNITYSKADEQIKQLTARHGLNSNSYKITQSIELRHSQCLMRVL